MKREEFARLQHVIPCALVERCCAGRAPAVDELDALGEHRHHAEQDSAEPTPFPFRNDRQCCDANSHTVVGYFEAFDHDHADELVAIRGFDTSGFRCQRERAIADQTLAQQSFDRRSVDVLVRTKLDSGIHDRLGAF